MTFTFTDNGPAVAFKGDGTGSVSYKQYLISAHFSRGRHFSTLEAADFDHDGVPDLWAVTTAGYATAYEISHLSASGATITAGKPEKLT